MAILAEVVQQPRQAGMEAGAENPHFEAPPLRWEALCRWEQHRSGLATAAAIATLPVSALRLSGRGLPQTRLRRVGRKRLRTKHGSDRAQATADCVPVPDEQRHGTGPAAKRIVAGDEKYSGNQTKAMTKSGEALWIQTCSLGSRES